MKQCPECNTENTLFVGGLISRCLRCGKDVTIVEDDWNED